MGANPLPPAERQFFDNNGVPLAGGTVAYYIPGGSTPKDTYQDAGASILNPNPIPLDAGGRAIIWGLGAYREVPKDSLGNTIYDQVTQVAPLATDFDDFTFQSLGGPPTSSQLLAQRSIVRALTIPANFNGTLIGGVAPVGSVGTNPTASFTITAKKNGSACGTIVISTAGAFTFATTSGLPVSFAAGDVLTFVAPSSTDATVANLSWAFSVEIN